MKTLISKNKGFDKKNAYTDEKKNKIKMMMKT